MIINSVPSASDQNSLDVSRAEVGFVAGDRPHFSQETAALLRSRLSAAALVIAVTLAAAFVGNLIVGTTALWWLRGIILLITVSSAVLVRSRRPLSLATLRLLELVVFGSLVFQMSLMLLNRVAAYAATNDATSLTSVREQFLMAWCVVIFIYGTLMPNNWKRGAIVMVSAAALPYLLIATQCWWMPEVRMLLSEDQARSPLPLPLVAAIVATFGTHVINSARREVFKARQFGQYRLMEHLGAGGMGDVYKAEHVLLKRPCAIKLIKPANESDAAVIARFEKEVKATAKLSHWNTVEIFDYGCTDDGTFYYVMELLPGMSLEEIVEKHGPMPP